MFTLQFCQRIMIAMIDMIAVVDCFYMREIRRTFKACTNASSLLILARIEMDAISYSIKSFAFRTKMIIVIKIISGSGFHKIYTPHTHTPPSPSSTDRVI